MRISDWSSDVCSSDLVLIGVRVDGFFEGLAQQELAAFRRRDVAVGAQHDVVRGQRVGRDEETQVALDDAALVLGEPVGVLPEGDRKRVVEGKGGSVRVDLVGGSIFKKKKIRTI